MGMKFIRGMVYPNANANGRGVSWRLKWTYEFWGFCINGTSNPLVPGGFASTNGVVMPTNFTGGTSLMAFGTDGAHNAVSGDLFSGDCVFTSASATFSPTMVGKALVIWKPNSDSSEDSIYVITRILNATQLVFNCNTGGTPNPTTKHPSMSARTNVCYRIVDMETGGSAGVDNGGFMVLQLDAPSINPGQGNSQIMLNHQAETHVNTSNYGNSVSAWCGVGLSGTGSWNGTPLGISSTTGAGVSPITITTVSPHGYTTGQTVNIRGVGGNTNANGTFQITVTGTNTFTLTGGLSGGTFPTALGTTTGNGTFGATIAAGSNGQSLPQSTINVNSTTGFLSSGTIFVTTSLGVQTVTYTSINGTQFLGCTGGTGTMSTGNQVSRTDMFVYNAFQNDGYSNIFGYNPNTSQAYTSGQTAITMIGDKTFYINHMREQDLFQFNLYFWFHFEIPQRLYPQGQDLHPITFNGHVSGGGVSTSSSTAGYGGGFVMRTHSSDISPARRYRTIVKAIRGDGTPDVFGQNLSDYRIGYNTIAGTIPVTDAMLTLIDVYGQYSLSRVRLRTVKFTGVHVPIHHRIGTNGEFIQLSNGVCWPWDNTILTNQLLLFGG